MNSISFALLDTSLLLADNGYHELIIPSMFAFFDEKKTLQSMGGLLSYFLHGLMDSIRPPLIPQLSGIILQSIAPFDSAMAALREPSLREKVGGLYVSFKSSTQNVQKMSWESSFLDLISSGQ